MLELAAVIAQLTGSTPQLSADPAMVALRLARASLDTLMLKAGQPLDARVTAQLSGGLTQFNAAGETLVLKLATPLPVGTSATIRLTPTPQGPPTVSVTVNAPPNPAPPPPPMPITAPPVAPPAAPSTPVQAAAPPQTTMPAPPPTTAGSTPPAGQSVPPSAQPSQPVATVSAHPTATASPAPALAAISPTAPPSATPVAAPSAATLPATTPSPPPAQPVSTSSQQLQGPVPPSPSTAPVPAPSAPAAQAVPPTLQQPALGQPVAQQPVPNSSAQIQSQSRPQPQPTAPSTPPSLSGTVKAPASPTARAAPAATRPTASPLNLADPVQAAARQDCAAPLMARLATLVSASTPTLPRPIIEVALKLLANRITLDRTPPDGKAIAAAVQRSGVLLDPALRQPSADSRSALLALRSGLLQFLGTDPASPVTAAHRAPPPIKGEPPRAPAPQLAPPPAGEEPRETARALLGQTEATLSRLKLLQSASLPEPRADAPAPRNELRVEIPLQLGSETGILQMLVDRDGRHKRTPERQRGWRMRFAMNLSATGEVGADIALLGRSASIALWAADPDTAASLEEMLPELAPAIARHGLELTSLRVRHGVPKPARHAPGQLLDSAR